MSANKLELLAAMTKIADFAEADAIGNRLNRCLASLVADKDGIGEWHEEESNPILKELLLQIHGTFAKVFLAVNGKSDAKTIIDIQGELPLLRKKIEILRQHTCVTPVVPKDAVIEVLQLFLPIWESRNSYSDAGKKMAKKLTTEQWESYKSSKPGRKITSSIETHFTRLAETWNLQGVPENLK